MYVCTKKNTFFEVGDDRFSIDLRNLYLNFRIMTRFRWTRDQLPCDRQWAVTTERFLMFLKFKPSSVLLINWHQNF